VMSPLHERRIERDLREHDQEESRVGHGEEDKIRADWTERKGSDNAADGTTERLRSAAQPSFMCSGDCGRR